MIMAFLESMIGEVPEGLEMIAYTFAMFWLMYITKVVFGVFSIFTGMKQHGYKF